MGEGDFLLALLVPLLLAVAVADARTGRIPNLANAAIALLGLLATWREAPELLGGRLADAAILGALLLLLRDLYQRRRRRVGLGLGDVKFLAAATLWTGLAGVPPLILAAALAALAAVGLRRLSGESVGGDTRLRFGPYLAGALLLVLLFARFTA